MPSIDNRQAERELTGTNCCVGEPRPQEEFTIVFTIDEHSNGRTVRLNVGANKLASVVEQLSKRYFITIE